MQLRQFVSGSAVILGVWLAITFFHEVPTQRYPKLDKHRRSAELPENSAPKTAGTAAKLMQVSASP